MENYAGACSARYLDVETLLGSLPPRTVAAVHIGGIAVECRLKALILNYHGITEWNQHGRRARDAYAGRPVQGPGHHLVSALKLMTRLFDKAKADPLFMKHLDQVMHPVGSRDIDFIALRYSANELNGDSLATWRKSLDYVTGWLKKNEVTS